MPPAPDGRPTLVYVLDLEAVCGACGKDAVRRYYLNTTFHSLTLARVRQLFDHGPTAIEGTCEQCDALLVPENVERWSMQCSPGDGQGLLVGIANQDHQARWYVAPHEFLDVQVQPVLEHDENDISHVGLRALDETAFYQAMGRYFNPKSAVRQLILYHHGLHTNAPLGYRPLENNCALLQAAPGLAFWYGNASLCADGLTRLPPYAASARLVTDGHIADHYPDAPIGWLGDLGAYVQTKSLVALCDAQPAEAALRRHFSRFPIDIEFVEEDAILHVIAGDGSLPQSVLDFVPSAIAQEAARTGAAPGDIARAELDRALTMLDFTTS